MKKLNVLAGALALTMLSAGSASAVTNTYDFTSNPLPTGPYTIGCIPSFIDDNCEVTNSGNGLGINGTGAVVGFDTQPDVIDQFGGIETLVIDFASAVTLEEVSLGVFDEYLGWFFVPIYDNDTAEYSIDGGATWIQGSDSPLTIGEALTSFWLRPSTASGTSLLDDFTLASMTITTVPVPAALPLLAGGLLGLGVLSRRRKRTTA